MNISIITIAYDGYGQYFSDWFGSILKQKTKPKGVVVVLSKKHEMVRVMPEVVEGIKVNIIYEPERKSMGELRNIAIRNTTTKWILSVDIDDVLLDNAIQDIKKLSKEADAIALRYYKKFNNKIEVQRTPIPSKETYLKWKESYCGASGYLAVKKKFKRELLLCEDTDFPNFPFMFKAGALGMRFAETVRPCAVYKKRVDGHGMLGTVEQRKEARVAIEKYARKYYNETL